MAGYIFLNQDKLLIQNREIFYVFSMTWPRIEPSLPALETYAITLYELVGPAIRYLIKFSYCIFVWLQQWKDIKMQAMCNSVNVEL